VYDILEEHADFAPVRRCPKSYRFELPDPT
jgi:hypothetical protein